MRYKLISFLIVSVFLLSCVLCGCGNNQTDNNTNEASPDSSSIHETTVVLETTTDGGTVEQDPEGNKITKDNEGKVTSVISKSGESLIVTEYLKTHSWVEYSDSSGGPSSVSGKPDIANEKTGSSIKPEKTSSNSSEYSGNNSNETSESKGDGVEGEIPVIIATLPDDKDLIELSD